MRHQYCCYFDHRYLARGLAMIRSLHRFEPDAIVWILCLNEQCYDILQALSEARVRLMRLRDLEEEQPELLAAKAGRSLVEYYFSCTPAFVTYILSRSDEGDSVTYV